VSPGERQGSARAGSNGRASAVPDSASSYYGQPVIKEPVWTWEIPCYLFTGGLAGASAGLALLGGVRDNETLARRAWSVAMFGVTASPVLLIMDLGKPMRFLNMLRMLKVTSPMSVGSWILVVSGSSTAVAVLHAHTGLLPGLARGARPVAAIMGLPLSTYTAALVANTAIPVWHEAHRELPYIFAAGAAASAGAAAVALTPAPDSAMARRLALVGSVAELAAVKLMERRLGEVGEPYEHGHAGRLTRLAKGLTATGAGVLALEAGRWRPAAIAGAGMIFSGAFAERWSVFRAGFQSASSPRAVIGPQRERIRTGAARGASVGSSLPC